MGTYTVQPGDTLYGIAFRQGVDFRDLIAWNGIEDPTLIHPGQTLRVLPLPGAPARRAVADGAASGPSAPVANAPPARPPASPSPPRSATTSPAPASPAPAAAAGKPPRATAPAATPGPRVATAANGVPAKGKWRWPADGRILSRFGDGGALGQGVDIAGKVGDPVLASAGGRVVYAGSGLIGYGKLIIVKHNDNYLSAYGHNEALLVDEGDDVAPGQKLARMGRGPGNRALVHFEIRLNGKPVNPLQFLPKRK